MLTSCATSKTSDLSSFGLVSDHISSLQLIFVFPDDLIDIGSVRASRKRRKMSHLSAREDG